MSFTAVVSGCNRGIGYAMLKGIAAAVPSAHLVLACRSEYKFKDTVEALKKDVQIDEKRCSFVPIDMQKDIIVSAFPKMLKNCTDKVDLLCLNAGIYYDRDDKESLLVQAERQITINYLKTAELAEGCLPMLNESKGRIVVTGSTLGLLKRMKDKRIIERMSDPKLTRQGLQDMSKQFMESVKRNTIAEDGYMKDIYGNSKAFINHYCRILGAEQFASGAGARVNVFCPGYTKTALTKWKGARTPEEGADTGIWLGIFPETANASGKFYQDRHEISYFDGTPIKA